MSSCLWRFHPGEYLLHSNEYAVLWQVILSVMKRTTQDEDVADGAGLSLYTTQIWAATLTSPPPFPTRALATCLAFWPQWPYQLFHAICTVLEPGTSAVIASSSDQEALRVATTDKKTLASMSMHWPDWTPEALAFPEAAWGGYSLHHRGGGGNSCFGGGLTSRRKGTEGSQQISSLFLPWIVCTEKQSSLRPVSRHPWRLSPQLHWLQSWSPFSICSFFFLAPASLGLYSSSIKCQHMSFCLRLFSRQSRLRERVSGSECGECF